MKEEWRSIPNFPGYRINQRGVVQNLRGYAPSRKGKRIALVQDRARIYMTVADLLDLAFPSDSQHTAPDSQRPWTMSASADDLQRQLDLARRVNGHLLALNKIYRDRLAALNML